jgi:hypothetical protein
VYSGELTAVVSDPVLSDWTGIAQRHVQTIVTSKAFQTVVDVERGSKWTPGQQTNTSRYDLTRLMQRFGEWHHEGPTQ